MRTFALQSGSSGNCYFYQSGDVKLLFDAGITWRCAAVRLAQYGISQSGFSGIFISHDHSDHTSCAGVFQRRLQAPLFSSPCTNAAMRHRLGKIKTHHIAHFKCGGSVDIGHVRVQTVPTPHDAAEPCAFIVDDGCVKVGILTDLGHGFPELRECLADLDVVYMESNYDDAMLESNLRYPYPLKQRIRGQHGHLENSESANLLNDCCGGRLKTVILSHLSGDNNTPDVAMTAHRKLNRRFSKLQFCVAPRNEVSPMVDIAGRTWHQAMLELA